MKATIALLMTMFFASCSSYENFANGITPDTLGVGYNRGEIEGWNFEMDPSWSTSDQDTQSMSIWLEWKIGQPVAPKDPNEELIARLIEMLKKD